MAKCEHCGVETLPGDLVPKQIDGTWYYFCSEKHAEAERSDRALKPVPSEVRRPSTPRTGTQRRRKKAGPA